MKSLGLIPVRTLAGNPHFERMAGWPDGSIGQSFLLKGREQLLGIAIPLVRCFDARAIRAQLSCTVSGDGLSERKFVQPAANIPQDYLGSAVFLSPEPSPVGPAVSFVMDPGIAESRFYGWYDYRYSSRDPFPSGHMSRGSRSEVGSDLTFHAFAGLPQS